MKYYKVVRDLQGGNFGMGRVQNAEGWLENMIDWRDADESWGDWGDGKDEYKDDREHAIAWWTEHIKTEEGGKDLIDYIAEMWGVEFEEVEPLKCPHCGAEIIDRLGAEKKLYGYYTPDGEYHGKDWGDDYEYYCDGCGKSLPQEFADKFFEQGEE